MNYLLRRKNLGKTSTLKISTYSKTGILARRNDEIPTEKADYVFRWGCTSSVPSGKVLNKAEAIHAVTDKAGFRLALQEIQPWFPVWFGGEEVKYPAVWRPGRHHQGRHLYVVTNELELIEAIDKAWDKDFGWYAAPLIDKVAEYRVFVVSGRACCVATKYADNPKQVAWNVAQGGHFENVLWDEWPLRVVKQAIKAVELSGLDYGGVDVMVDKENQTYILEINAAPSLTSPYRQQCFAKAFDYIVQNGNATIPLQKEPGGYKKFIHPAIKENI